MANKFLLKKSSVAGRVPQLGDLEYGELALNYSDGKLYYKSAGNIISSFNADLSSYVTLSGTQTLTNKTLTSPNINNGTVVLTAGTLKIPTSSNPAQTEEGDIVWDSSLDLLTVGTSTGRRTMVDTSSSQTLTNKTLTAPSISAATLTGSLTVSNGIGTSGQVLTSTGSGLQWATQSGGSQYTLPIATDTTLGGVKIGSGISINVDGVISGFSGSYADLSGKPTIPSAIFSTIAVTGQSNVVADSATDTLTLVAGDNITITTNATNDSITISSASQGGGGSQYTLPIASVSTLGGIKIGSGLTIDYTGVVDVIGASGSTASGVVPWDAGYLTEIVYSLHDLGSIV